MDLSGIMPKRPSAYSRIVLDIGYDVVLRSAGNMG